MKLLSKRQRLLFLSVSTEGGLIKRRLFRYLRMVVIEYPVKYPVEFAVSRRVRLGFFIALLETLYNYSHINICIFFFHNRTPKVHHVHIIRISLTHDLTDIVINLWVAWKTRRYKFKQSKLFYIYLSCDAKKLFNIVKQKILINILTIKTDRKGIKSSRMGGRAEQTKLFFSFLHEL